MIKARVLNADCLTVLRKLPDNSMHAIVTDPPYGLSNTDPKHVAETIVKWASGEREYAPTGKGFMGKEWDAFVPPPAVWDECFRVLKPGGHLLCFAGTRTMGLMDLSIRLAGFDIRDSLAWLYGSGFPKSMNVSKAIDKDAGVERPVVGTVKGAGSSNTESLGVYNPEYEQTTSATDEARAWEGWGTALKPAFEPVIVARKPFKGTVAKNVLTHGTGALNIDATRIGTESVTINTFDNGAKPFGDAVGEPYTSRQSTGRWPANVLLDESQAVELDEQTAHLHSAGSAQPGGEDRNSATSMFGIGNATSSQIRLGDSGGASRFFYVAKANKHERPDVDGVKHPTVKPLALMRWLVRLVTPTGGIVLDPFGGSGTTAEACILEGFDSLTLEADASYIPLIQSRIDRAKEQLVQPE